MSSAVEGLRVAVIGGSLGGLSCALELGAIGCEVDVFERSSTPLEGRGAGIVLHPVTTAFLEAHAAIDLDDVSAAASTLRYLAPSGDVEHEESIAYRFTSYASLHAALLDAFAPGRYHLGHELEGLDDAWSDPVVSRFRNGVIRRSALLVGADGIRSTIRGLLDPGSVPRSAGYVAWRGIVGDADLPAAASSLRGVLTYHVGRRTHMLTYEIPAPSHDDGRSMNWVWYRNVDAAALGDLLTDREGRMHDLSLPPGQVREPFLDELRSAADGLPPAFSALVGATPDPFVQVVVDLEPRALAFGRVGLVGDAACALRPHIAVGTAKAVDDGRALAEALARTGSVVDALTAWEPERLALAQATTARARAVGERAQISGSFRPGDPSVAFGLREPFDGAYPGLLQPGVWPGRSYT